MTSDAAETEKAAIHKLEDVVDLGKFLQARRARVNPGEVGLPDNDRRRVPGLRREELALLAGVSVDYYTRLEQGRAKHRRIRCSTRWRGRCGWTRRRGRICTGWRGIRG